MTDLSNRAIQVTSGGSPQSQRLRLALVICIHIVVCCISLAYAAYYKKFFIFYDGAQLYYAIAAVASFALISPAFVFAGFSFGYFVGFHFYMMVLGFLWLNCFSKFNYNHQLAGYSAVASAVVFLLPALFISSPLKQVYVLSAKALGYVLGFILWLTVATIAVSAIYNFRFVSLENIYEYRNALQFPTILNYLTGMITTTLLPFAFACYLTRKQYWQAGIALLLLLSFYPVTLTKIAFFAPAWLITLAVLLKVFEVRITVVLSLFLPTFAGVLLIVLFGEQARPFFDIINLRMIAIPSSALDVYNDFFSRHDFTYFCQISILKLVMNCPYQDQLSLVMRDAYATGNFNASLFATEGVASVGPLFAPVAVFVCGLVIALGNRVSAGLPARFILISSAILPQVFLNVQLTAILLTHGVAILFLLWYIIPRSMFEQERPVPDVQ